LIALILLLSLAGATNYDVKTLRISFESNADLLPEIGRFKKLEKLTIVCLEDLKALPAEIGKLSNLRELDLDNGNGCLMNAALPETIGDLTKLRVLNLANAQAAEEPSRRHELPRRLARLTNLEILDLTGDAYTQVPPVVARIPNLKHLRLRFNPLEDLPAWFATSQLETVDLGDICKITNDSIRRNEIAKRFPKIKFNFTNEYDCP